MMKHIFGFRSFLFLFFWSLVCLGAACGDSGGAENQVNGDGGSTEEDGSQSGMMCVDMDNDLRGENCTLGPDCNDMDATQGGAERCDKTDNDCDGITDEGLSLCTTCTPSCAVAALPETGAWDVTGDGASQVGLTSTGALRVAAQVPAQYGVWVVNRNHETVSKLDPQTNMEVARYPSLNNDVEGTTPLTVEEQINSDTTIRNAPQNIAVDQNLDAYVVNRGSITPGKTTVTKYANLESDCVDRNSNGTIDTSRDANGDGTIDISDPTEYVGASDECILWTAPVGKTFANGRTITVAPAVGGKTVGNLWVGLQKDWEMRELDPETGDELNTVVLEDASGGVFQVHDTALAPDGRIAIVSRQTFELDELTPSGEPDPDSLSESLLAYLDPNTRELTWVKPLPNTINCPDNGQQTIDGYGLSVAVNGDVFLTVPDCVQVGLLRYDVSEDSWSAYRTAGVGTTVGVTADNDVLYVARSGNTFKDWEDPSVLDVIQVPISAFDEVSFDVNGISVESVGTLLTLVGGRAPQAISRSFDGALWVVSSVGSESTDTGIASRWDPSSQTWSDREVGLTAQQWQSDFIGYNLSRFTTGESVGRYDVTVSGCATGETTWTAIDFLGKTPSGTTVRFFVRTADSRDALAEEDFVGPFTGKPVALTGVSNGTFAEIRLQMDTEDLSNSPEVTSMSVAFNCLNP